MYFLHKGKRKRKSTLHWEYIIQLIIKSEIVHALFSHSKYLPPPVTPPLFGLLYNSTEVKDSSINSFSAALQLTSSSPIVVPSCNNCKILNLGQKDLRGEYLFSTKIKQKLWCLNLLKEKSDVRHWLRLLWQHCRKQIRGDIISGTWIAQSPWVMLQDLCLCFTKSPASFFIFWNQLTT